MSSRFGVPNYYPVTVPPPNIQQHGGGNASVAHQQAQQHQNINVAPTVVVQTQKNNLVNSALPPNEYNVVMNHQQSSHQHGGIMNHSTYRGHLSSKYDKIRLWPNGISGLISPMPWRSAISYLLKSERKKIKYIFEYNLFNCYWFCFVFIKWWKYISSVMQRFQRHLSRLSILVIIKFNLSTYFSWNIGNFI